MATVPLTATFATGGVFSWVAPPGVTSVACACTGAGGGGGAANTTSGSQGGGGGGGEAAYEPALPVTPGTSYLVIVGTGGLGGNFATGALSTAGGQSSFAGDPASPTLTIAVVAHGGARGTQGTTGAGQGGGGGTGSTNAVSAAGGAGSDGTVAANGGGGGGAAGASAVQGFPGGTSTGSGGGTGGGGTFPGGAGAAGAASAGNGSAGTGPGGGGSGALSTGTGHNGGAGADGQVVITWTMTDPVVLPNDTVGGTWKFTAPLGVTAVKAEAVGAGAGGFAGAATGALCGSSAFTVAYGSPRSAAATTFDNRVGRPMATNVQITYYQEEQYPSSAADDQQGTAALTAMGCGIIASFRLSRRAVVAGGSALTAQQTQFAAALSYLVAVPGIQLRGVCLANEPGINGQHGPFGDGTVKDWNFPSPYGTPTKAQTAVNYLAYWAAFVPTAVSVLAGTGIPVLYKPTVTSQDMSLLMFPGGPSSAGGCDGVIIDWYATDQPAGATPFGAANMEGLCDQAGVGLGLGEWGAAGGSNGPSLAQWNNYITAMANGFTARFNGAKKVLDAVYFGGLSTTGQNTVTSSTDYKVAGIQQIYDLFAGSHPAGGAGGGGGEYAAEASLAVTGQRSYTLVVGNAGTAGTSGTATTVAGDSVTVTAHPGLAATSSVGGAGGTGSANTTHHDGGAGGAGGGQGGAGGGGGSSGGSAASGNAGTAGTATTGGAGGTAVTGGGPGGKGGGPAGNGTAPTSGPGGGGGARGATGSNNGAGFDGQITLSNFTTGTGAAGSCALAPLGSTGTATINAGNAALGALASSATVAVGGFTLLHDNTTSQNAGTGTLPVTITASTAGTLLVATVVTGGTTVLTAPAPWINASALVEGGGAGGRLEMWYLPGHLNAGGITSVTFTGNGTTDTMRGSIAEYVTPMNTTQALNGTPGTASAAGPATSFPVSYAGTANVGDLGVAAFADKFTASTSGTWTTPSGWIKEAGNTGSANWFTPFYKTGLLAGTQSVTSGASTSTNQSGWAAILAVFTVIPVNTTTGSAALAPLAATGTGTAGVPAGTVVSNGAGALGALGAQSPSLANTFPEQPLPVTVEILVNNAWTDISSYVYVRDGITISNRGRPNEASTAQPAQVTLTLNNRGGDFSPGNTGGQFYPYLVRNIQLRISVAAITSTGANYGLAPGSGYRFWGQVPAWPPQWDLSGNDVYVPITAVGVLQRMQQSKYSASPIARYYTNIMNQALNGSPGTVPVGVGLVPAAYWPCEDSAPTQIPALKTLQAASFASGLPGGSPMTWTGTPSLASDSSVLGSQPFAQLSGSVWTGTPGAFTSGGITFTTPGTYKWVCPGDVTTVQAECWGGGGGGGGFNTGGNGGGGGEYAKETTVTVTPGNTYTVVVGVGGDGSPGGSQGNGVAGGDGFKSTFAGDNITVTAHGGQGAHTHQAVVASGGTGSSNTVHHDGGNGAINPGNPQFGGQGGGGSGGTGAGGNNGHQNSGSNNDGGAGGSAVAGGGPGGAGGRGYNGGTLSPQQGFMPSPGPGGGGGGGGFNNFTNYRRAGGGGQSGQVTLTFGTSSKPSANVLRAVLDIPAGTTGVTGAQYLQAQTSGTVAFLNLTYQGTGHLELRGRDSGNNLLFDSGSIDFGAVGQPMLVSCELTQTSTGFFPSSNVVTWKLKALAPGADHVIASASGTITSAVVGSVTHVNVNNAAGNTETAAVGIGHVSVQYAVDPILNLSPALNAYTGEFAADRFLRLCTEQNVPVQIFTSPSDTPNNPDTPAMGPQPVGLLVDLLQDCENTDLGLMFERRDAFGLGYITRAALQNQPAAAVLDYAAKQLGNDLAPTDDEQLIRNDVVATRASGGTSYEAIQMTGPLSVLDPPNGVGLYQYQVTVNVQADTQLAGFAQWLLALGTLDEYRYPQIVINLMRPAVRDGTFGAVPNLDVGDMITIVNPPAWLPQGPINQLCYGFTETLNAKEWTITVNAVPADPYISTGTLPSW